MSLTALESQIVSAYEDCGLSVDEICAEFAGLEREAVIVALQRGSSLYNKGVKSGEEEAVLSADEVESLKGVLMELATGAECEAVKLNAAKFMWNEAKGRNDAVKNIGKSVTVNVLQINEQLQKGQSRYAAAKERLTQLVTSGNNQTSSQRSPAPSPKEAKDVTYMDLSGMPTVNV